MNSETLHIDQLLQTTYAGFEPAMPAFAWDGIEAKLDAKKNRKFFGWWKAAALVAVLSGVATLYWTKSSETASNSGASTSNKNSSAGSSEKVIAGDKGNDAENISNNSTGLDGQNQTDKATATPNQRKKNRNLAPYYSPLQNTDATDNGVSGDNGNTDQAESQQETYEILGKNLVAFGPRMQDVERGVNDVPLTENEPKQLNKDIDPYKKIGVSKFIVGMGVGQIVNASGISVNPEYKNYVHEDYLKRMREGEGLLSALSFSGTLGYEVAENNFIYTGLTFFQRRNSLDFNFTYYAPVTGSTNGEKADKNGNYPIYDYLRVNPLQTQYKGTNIFTEFDLPIGWMGQYKINKNYTFMPSVSASLGFISISDKNATLDYSVMELVGVNKNWYKKSFALLGASAGIYRDLGSNLKWGVNASGNYTLTQMYVSGSTIRPRAFTGGLSAQLLWRLD